MWPEENWKLSLKEVRDADCKSAQQEAFEPRARCAVSATLRDSKGLVRYLVVCAGRNELLFFSQGELCAKLTTPSVIHSICVGNFGAMPNLSSSAGSKALDAVMVKKEPSDSSRATTLPSPSLGSAHDIALGAEDGLIYLLRDWTIQPCIDVGVPIYALATLRDFNNAGQATARESKHKARSAGSASGSAAASTSKSGLAMDLSDDATHVHTDADTAAGAGVDALVCAGDFDGWKLYCEGKLLHEQREGDFVCSLSVGDVTGSGCEELAVCVPSGARVYRSRAVRSAAKDATSMDL